MIQARYGIHSLFQRLRYVHHHLVDGRHAGVGADHDPRKIRAGENGDWNRQRKVYAHRDQRQDDKNDRLAVAGGPVLAFPARGDRWECRKLAHFPFWFPPSFF